MLHQQLINESVRNFSKKSTVVFSTNKVYGDNPNKLNFRKNLDLILKKKFKKGINEDFNVDNCTHSFGVSKLPADLLHKNMEDILILKHAV